MTVFVCADTLYEPFFFQSRKNPFRLSLANVQLPGCRFCRYFGVFSNKIKNFYFVYANIYTDIGVVPAITY